METLPFIQVGLGPLGVAFCREALRTGRARPVLAVDPAHAGQDLGELVEGGGSVSIEATIPALDSTTVPCAVVTTLSDLALCAETFRALLKQGVDVVSSCEELAWPWLRHAGLAEELDATAREAGARILGTGVNPGFLMDAFPLYFSALASEVNSIEIGRVQDASTRRVPFQKKIGAALTPAEFEAARRAGTLRHVGLAESLHLVAHGLDWALDRWEETLEPVLAERDLTCALGPIASGQPSGVRQVARGWQGDQLRLELTFQAAIGQPEPRDWVRIDATPPLELVIPGAVHGDSATIAMLLSGAQALRSSPPGLHTMASLPGLGCRAGLRP